MLGDVRDFFSVREAMQGREVVFHLAALIGIPYSYQAPQSYLQTNVEGTLNVLQAARELETGRVICTSTSEVYGTAQYVPIDEKHPLQGQSPYSASKIAADMLAESYFRSFGTAGDDCAPLQYLRPAAIGTRGDSDDHHPGIGGSEIRLGSISPTRDFNFVEDTVEGFIQAAAS